MPPPSFTCFPFPAPGFDFRMSAGNGKPQIGSKHAHSQGALRAQNLCGIRRDAALPGTSLLASAVIMLIMNGLILSVEGLGWIGQCDGKKIWQRSNNRQYSPTPFEFFAPDARG